MIKQLLFIFFAALLTQSAAAGPWLQEKGNGFLSTSVVGTYSLDTASQTYLEYGLSDETTVIANVGFLRPRYALGGGYATLSMRRALSTPDASSKWAYELGVGAAWLGDETLPHIRTALSWGRGMNWGDTTGWATVEAAVIWDLSYAQHVAKIDTTLGVNFTDVTTGMLQLYTAHLEGTSIATIAPSLVFRPKDSKFRIQIGAESELGNTPNSALKLGLWREF